MNVEIFTYIAVFISTLLCAVSNNMPTLLFRVWLFILSLCYVASIRLSGFNGDIVNYAEALRSSSTSIYYYKEFFYWFSSRIIFGFFRSDIATFVVIDLFVISAFFASLKMFKAPRYAFFLILIIFPSIFGFQNIYRQLIASSVLLLGLGVIYSGKRFGFFYGVLAAATHNPAAFAIPISISFIRRSRWLGAITGILFGAALGILSQFESTSASGGNFSFILSGVVIAILFFLSRNYKRHVKQPEFIGFFYGLVPIAFFSPMLLAPSTAERLMFYMFMLLLPFFVLKTDDTFRPKFIARFFIVLLFTGPTFASSGLGFLL